MQLRSSFKIRLLAYLFVVFLIFTTLILLFQYGREKDYRRKQLESNLDHITELTSNFIKSKNLISTGQFDQIDSLKAILPIPECRITLIDTEGRVLYDNEVADVSSMENHKTRPEVMGSVSGSHGSNIRKSNTTGEHYFYYAKFYNSYFVRTAVVYNIQIRNFLRAEKLFLLIIIALFIFTAMILVLVTGRVTKTITNLKDFATTLLNQGEYDGKIDFPKDDLGVIAKQITSMYLDQKLARDQLSMEREKLLNHLNTLNEGIAFFSRDKQTLLQNNNFIQNLNLITGQTTVSAEKIFEATEFKPIVEFLEKHSESNTQTISDEGTSKELQISSGGKYFTIRCFIFSDLSFEIMLVDETKLEKRRLLKQQMTSNIAHELKTPVASVLGYLETLKSNNLESEKQKYFIDRAFYQASRLSDLIEDISMLNKLDETRKLFEMKPVQMYTLVNELKETFLSRKENSGIEIDIDIPKDLKIKGNESLLHSIFHNLIDNSIKYGGEHVKILISNYLNESSFSYFSVRNTGPGIPEEHLSRIFERFYRIDSGRSRKTGGTGLGLAIVKNAVQLHNGEISAKNLEEGGLDFLFTLGQ